MNEASTKFSLSPTEALNKAWHAVTTNLGPMVGFVVLFYVASAIVGLIPYVSNVTNLFQFIFSVSLFSAFDSIERHGRAGFSDLFNWGPKFGRLLSAYLIVIGLAIVAFLPMLILLFSMLGTDFLSAFSGGRGAAMFSQFDGVSAGIIAGIFLLGLVGGILLAVFTFGFMFIVQFRNMSLMESLKLSFRIGRENFGQIIVFALLSIGVVLLGLLAIVLGLLIAVPLVIGMQYYLLRSILPTKEEASQWDFMRGDAPRA